MSRTPPCPACGLPFGEKWLQLASSARGIAAATHLCPRCTLGRTMAGGALPTLSEQYCSRLQLDHDSCALEEQEDGSFDTNSPAWIEAINARRFNDALHGLEHAKLEGAARILQVGSGDGRFLDLMRDKMGAEVTGVEPWEFASKSASARRVVTHERTLEALDLELDPELRFDLIIEHHVLEHLADPRAHLRAVARRLSDDGVAVIEVPNLLRAQGRLETRFLRPEHPLVFTARALATLCRRSGLEPIELANTDDLRIFCRRANANSGRAMFKGPDAKTVAGAAWSNDLRLGLKRGLARRGCTEALMNVANRIHQRCAWPSGRADIAIEIGVALEREGRLEESADWLRTSLQDRPDGEVSCMIVRLDTIARHGSRAGAPPTVTPMPPLESPEPRADYDPLAVN